MKGSIRSILNPYLIILLLLSIIIPTFIMPIDEVQAAVSDNVTITSPTTAAPVYAKAAGQARIFFDVNVDTTAAGDVTLIAYYAGTSTIVGQTDVSSVALTAGGNSKDYYITIWSGTTAGPCDVKVGVRQPAGSGTYTFSALRSNAIIIDNTAPSAPTLSSPATGTYTTDNTPTLGWTAVTKTGHTILYNVQVDNVSTSFTNMEVNASGVIGTTPPTYTTAALSDGLKYWRVCAVDNASNQSAWPTAWNFFVDTVAPTAVPTPTAPANGSTVGGSYNPTLTWADNVTDPAPSSGLRYWVQVSNDIAFPNAAISENITTITNTTYTPGAALSAGTWYWRVRARDLAWNTTGWGATRSFIKPASVTAYTVPLGTGWNLISMPLCPSGSTTITPANFITACDNATSVGIIWGYNEATSSWQFYIPGYASNTLTSMSVTKGYWVQSTSPTSFTITGSSCPPPPYSAVTATLYPGWNLIGFKSTSNTAANTYLGTTASALISYVCRYPAGWECGAPAAITYQPGQGSWVFLGGTSNCQYGLPCN